MKRGEINYLLKSLKLPSMAQIWEEMAKKALDEGWSPVCYLEKLCEMELAGREQRRIERHMQQAMLPKGKSLERFDFKEVEGLKKEEVMSLSNGALWLEKAINILIFGPSGCGKTHLAAAIGEKLVEDGYRVFFVRTAEIVQTLQKAKESFSLPSALAKLDKYDCIILDDFGYEQKSEGENGVLFELISERYERRSTILTCNQPFEEWEKIFGNQRMAVAAVDRLIHHSRVFVLKGESYRKKSARRVREREKEQC